MPVPLVASEFDERAVALSPDGRWLAYESDETGRDEVYVRPFPEVARGKWTVSVGGGSRPLWAHSGRELFYTDGQDRLVAAGLRLDDALQVTDRRSLFSTDEYLLGTNYTQFDVSPDDQRFLMLRRVGREEGESEPRLVLVENWFEELRQKLRTR